MWQKILLSSYKVFSASSCSGAGSHFWCSIFVLTFRPTTKADNAGRWWNPFYQRSPNSADWLAFVSLRYWLFKNHWQAHMLDSLVCVTWQTVWATDLIVRSLLPPTGVEPRPMASVFLPFRRSAVGWKLRVMKSVRRPLEEQRKPFCASRLLDSQTSHWRNG